MKISLGQRIKLVRKKESQDVFAVNLGISRGALSSYERDESQPNAEVLQKICAKYNILPEWLLFGTGFMDDCNKNEHRSVVEGAQPSIETVAMLNGMKVKMDFIEESLQQTSIKEQAASCPKCLELAERLLATNERLVATHEKLVAANDRERELLLELGQLREENTNLKNGVPASGESKAI